MDKIIEKKKWYQKKTTWITGIIVILVLALFTSILSDTSSKLNVETEKITIAEVKFDYFQDYMAAIGTVMPITTIYLDAMEGGRVEELLVEEGAMVDKNQPILRLSNPDLNLSILNSEAELAEKTNHLRNTEVAMEQNKLDLKKNILDINYQILKLRRTFKNNKKFYKQNLISEEEYLTSKEDYEYAIATRDLLLERQKQDSIYRKVQVYQLKFSLNRMKQNLELVNNRLDNLIVKAPVKGQLGTLNAEIGEAKTKGQRLGMINVLDAYKVRAEIDEHYITDINTNLFAEFDFDDTKYKLKVKKVYPDVRNGRFTIDLNFPGDVPPNIRTGQTFRIKVELAEPSEAIIIPKGGFFQSTGGQWIYVINESEGYAEKREIRINRQNPRFYEVMDGLEPGERVIVSSYDNFGDVDKLVLKE